MDSAILGTISYYARPPAASSDGNRLPTGLGPSSGLTMVVTNSRHLKWHQTQIQGNALFSEPQ